MHAGVSALPYRPTVPVQIVSTSMRVPDASYTFSPRALHSGLRAQLDYAAQAISEDALASVINRMLSELHTSRTRYYTPDEPEYYQLADIFAGELR